MWWYRAAVLALAVLLCAGCGFRPLYGSTAEEGTSPDVLDALAATEVRPIADRAGQLLRNELRLLLAPAGVTAAPRYILEVGLQENLIEVAIQRTGLPTRADLRINANYSLRDATTNLVLLQGRSNAVSSYDLVENKFSTLIAEKDARTRAVSRLASDIRTRLGVYYGTLRTSGA